MRILLLNEINKYDAIGIELLSAILKKHSHWARVCIIPDLIKNTTISLKCLNLLKPLFFVNDDTYIEYLMTFDPDIIAFSAVTSYIGRCAGLARLIRKKMPHIKLIVGGSHPTVATENTVKMNCFDFVCKGEGEILLPRLVDAIEKHTKEPNIPGVYYLKEKKIRGYGMGEIIKDIDEIPFPDKDDVIQDYPFFEGVYIYNSMRSCPFSCSYCGSPHMRKEYHDHGMKVFRRKSVRRVIEELTFAKEKYPKIHTIGFVDDVLTMGKKWVFEFAIEYEKYIGIPFFGCTNPSLLCDEDMIRQLKKAGMVYVEIGVQALDEKFRMGEINRPDSNKDILKCAHLLRKYNIYIQVNHIFGLDKRDYIEDAFLQKTVEFYLKLHPNRTHCFELEYLPKTEISMHHLGSGELNQKEYLEILNGNQSVSYNFGGSIKNKKKFIPYIVLLEMRPFLPEKMIRFLMYHSKAFKIIKKIPLSYLVVARLLNTLLNPKDVEGKPHYGKYWSGMKHIIKIKKSINLQKKRLKQTAVQRRGWTLW